MDPSQLDSLVDAQVRLPTAEASAKVLFLRQPSEWALEEEARTQETPFLFRFKRCNVWVYGEQCCEPRRKKPRSETRSCGEVTDPGCFVDKQTFPLT